MGGHRSEEHTSELQSQFHLVCRLLLEKKKLVYNASMERILFDGRPYLHSASLPGMAERTITVGSVSKEYRMIGWRVGCVVGPTELIADVDRVNVYKVLTTVVLTRRAAGAALDSPDSELAEAVAKWHRERILMVEELRGEPLFFF